jgi:hypothetical protein
MDTTARPAGVGRLAPFMASCRDGSSARITLGAPR